jgi:hypothetical protein
MFRYLPILASAVVLVAYGLVEGYWTDRWALSPDLAEAQERLAAIPLEVGNWQGEDGDLDPRAARQADIRAALVRTYANRQTGAALNVLLVAGRSGPIAVHSPEMCLGGSGFSIKGKKTREPIAGAGLSGDDAFWVAQFHKADAAVPEVIEVTWAWTAGGDWQAVENPRLTFARKRVLYKLYVTRRVTRSADAAPAPDSAGAAEQAPVHEFLKVFLPEVKRSLFPG